MSVQNFSLDQSHGWTDQLYRPYGHAASMTLTPYGHMLNIKHSSNAYSYCKQLVLTEFREADGPMRLTVFHHLGEKSRKSH